MLDRVEFLDAIECRVERCEVPGLGTVHVRELSGSLREKWAGWAFNDDGAGADHFRERLVIYCLCDSNGTPMLSGADLPELSTKSGRAIHAIYDHAARVNGIGRAAEDEAAKNS